VKIRAQLRILRVKHFFLLLLFTPSLVVAQNIDKSLQVSSLFESYHYDEALVLTNQLLSQDSMNANLILLKSKILASFNKNTEAVNILQKHYKYDSTNLKVLGSLIEYSNQGGETEKACGFARKRLSLAPDNRYFSFQLANLYYQLEKYRKGLDILLPLYSKDSLNISLIKQITNGLLEINKADSAILFCKKILRILPDDPWTTNKLANIYIRINAINKGILLTDNFIRKDSANIAILKSNAYLNYLAKDYDRAILRFKRSFTLGDTTRFSYKYTAMSYYRLELYDTAFIYMKTTYEMDTTENEILFYFGVCAGKNYRHEEGLKLLNKVLVRQKSAEQFVSLVCIESAALYNDMMKPDTALAFLNKAYERNPTNIDILFRLGYQYDLYMQNPKEALIYYHQYMQLSDDERKNKVTVKKAGEVNMSLYEYAQNRVGELEKK